jgi:hypothetical protein
VIWRSANIDVPNRAAGQTASVLNRRCAMRKNSAGEAEAGYAGSPTGRRPSTLTTTRSLETPPELQKVPMFSFGIFFVP